MLPLLLCLILGAGAGDATLRRIQYRDELREILPRSRPWEIWLKESAELPPDFEALPSRAPMPEPLTLRVDGEQRPIGTPQAWEAHRETLKALFQQWILGRVPPPPAAFTTNVLAEHEDVGALLCQAELHFGQGAKLWVELLIPKGDGPFPVFLTQYNHRPWALLALRRGYLACLYAGCDSRDDTDTFLTAYPGYDWGRLARRAWAASRCIDYLEEIPQANTRQIALAGHSRNGKLSLIASALDERIAVVISSSSGAGGCLPARYCGEHHFEEGIETITRYFPDWFHPRWRFFAGREHKLPVDLNQLVALSAPRSCLLSIALNDEVESSWAIQQTYLSVKPVYELYEVPQRLGLLWRPGGHETWPAVIERYVDWCDLQFGRGSFSFTERLIHPWDWEGWKEASGIELDATAFPERDRRLETESRGAWEKQRKALTEAVRTVLGEAPPGAAAPPGSYGKEPLHIEQLLGRAKAGYRLEKDDFTFGEYLNADVYLPEGRKDSGVKSPAILWLHPHSCARGYVAGYRRGEDVFRSLARAGYAVFCYDQLGFGRRIEEVEGFYKRYPRWSLLGKMVRDAQAALDAMADLPYLDTDRIWVAGYGLGAMAALHLGALDERPAGYVLGSIPPPFRLDTDPMETGGIQRWSHLYMLIPKLGFFVGAEQRIPYDVDELLATLAPRPVLVVSPQLDRSAPLACIREAVASARTVYALYGAAQRLVQKEPHTYNHFDPSIQALVMDWLERAAGESHLLQSGSTL